MVVGLTPAGNAGDGGSRLIVQGSYLECLNAASGSRQWRWEPPTLDDMFHGASALAGGSVYAPVASGLYRISIADGHVQAFSPWSKLGLDRPFGNLIALRDSLIGFSAGRVMVLQAGAQAAAPIATVIPAVPRSSMSALESPAAEFAPPLRWRWHLAAGADNDIYASAGGVYADLGDRLARVDPATGKTTWESPCAPGIKRVAPSQDVVMAVYERSVAIYEAATGRLLWTRPIERDDVGFTLDYEKWMGERSDGVSISAAGVAIHIRNSRVVSVFNAKTGALIAKVAFGANVLGASVIGSEVVAVLQGNQKCWVEGRAPNAADAAWKLDLPGVPMQENAYQQALVLVAPDQNSLCLCLEFGVACVDLVAKQAPPFQRVHMGDRFNAYFDGGLLVIRKRLSVQSQYLAFEPKSGKLVFDQQSIAKEPPYGQSGFRFAGDFAVGTVQQRPAEPWITMCRKLSTGQQQWAVEFNNGKSGRSLHRVDIAGAFVALIYGPQQDRGLTYRLLDLASGRHVGEGALPGLRATGHELHSAFVDGALLYTAQQGIYAVGGLAAASGAASPLEAALTRARSAAAEPVRGHEGALELLANYASDARSALASAKPRRIDGHLDEWVGTEQIRLADASASRRERAEAWKGSKDCSATAQVGWDRQYLYVAIDIVDDDACEPAPGANPLDGDCVVLGIDPDDSPGSSEDGNPTVIALALSAGRPRMVQLSGRPVDVADDQRVLLRVVRKAEGWAYEAAVPWSSLREADERGERRSTAIGVGLAVMDWDGGKPEAAMEWGYGLARGIDAQLFNRINLVDMTPERVASFRAFIELMPEHEFSARFLANIAGTYLGEAGIAGRIKEFESFLTAHPATANSAWAVAELSRLYVGAGKDQPRDATAAFARKAGVPPRAIGDGAGPCSGSDDLGRAFVQWVYLDPQHPPRQVQVGFRHPDWEWSRVYWGQRDPSARVETAIKLGSLPPTKQWTKLVVPIAAVKIDGQLIENLSFGVDGGIAYWGRSEFVIDGKTQVLIDGDLPKGCSLAAPAQWGAPEQDGKKSHTAGDQSGETNYGIQGPFKFDLRGPEAAAPKDEKQRLQRGLEAARLIADTDEALKLLRDAEALHKTLADKERGEAVHAMYADFLRAAPGNPLAYKALAAAVGNGNDPVALAWGEAQMEAIKLPREQRRLFWRGIAHPIAEWKGLGYFDPDKGAQNLQETLPPERGAIDLAAHYQGMNDKEVSWQDLKTDGNAALPKMKAEDKPKWPIAYFFTRVQASEAVDAVLMAGCRGRCLVWVNGKRLGQPLAGGRGNIQRDAHALPVRLNKGMNDILIKATDLDGTQAISCRFADANGRPLAGVTVALSDNGGK
jgi:hypothetical protein